MNAKIKRSGITLLIVLAFLFTMVPAASAHTDEVASLQQTSKAFSSVAKKAVPAVVFIKVEKSVKTGSMVGPGSPFGNNDENVARWVRVRALSLVMTATLSRTTMWSAMRM